MMKTIFLVLALPLLLTGCAGVGVGVDVGGPGYPGYYDGYYYGGPDYVGYYNYNRGYYYHSYHHYTHTSVSHGVSFGGGHVGNGAVHATGPSGGGHASGGGGHH